jgi:FkbM family methyltransferase
VAVHGVELRLDHRWASSEIRNSIYIGSYERAEIDVLRRTLKPGDEYMEVGGGIGVVAVAASKIVGASHVHVYEANPVLAGETIPETARLNGLELDAINAVLGQGTGKRDFYVGPDFWASSLDPDPSSMAVEVTQLDLASEFETRKPTYLMVDIEGGEAELLGEARLPGTLRAACIEMHPHRIGADAVNAVIANFVRQGLLLDVDLSGDGSVFLAREDGAAAT